MVPGVVEEVVAPLAGTRSLLGVISFIFLGRLYVVL